MTTTRTIATLATLAMAALIFAVPSVKAEDAAKIEDRFSMERITAPALEVAAGLDAAVLAAHAERAGKSDRLDVARSGDCQGTTWPNIPLRCLFTTDGIERTAEVRTITIEQRVGENTSVLMRVPAAVAQR